MPGEEEEQRSSTEGISRGKDIVKLDGWGYADSGSYFIMCIYYLVYIIGEFCVGERYKIGAPLC